MLEKLKKVEEKFDFISAELCKSEVVSDMELYKKYMQELRAYAEDDITDEQPIKRELD